MTLARAVTRVLRRKAAVVLDKLELSNEQTIERSRRIAQAPKAAVVIELGPEARSQSGIEYIR